MATFPSKVNYATGDILTATNMNDVGGAINLLDGAQFAAGKNKIINGDFGVWQRGTSFTVAATPTYTADRFVQYRDGSGATVTTSQQTFTAGTAPVAGYEGTYFLRFAQTVAGTGCTYSILGTRLEDVRTLAGQTATFSFWAKSDAARSLNIQLIQQFGSGGSSSVYINPTAQSITTSWARYSVTISIPSISGKTIGTGSNLEVSFAPAVNTVQTIDTWGWQLEAASTASNFQTATGTKQGELAACQRYYFRYGGGTNYDVFSGYSNAISTTQTISAIQNPVPMRVIASSVEYSTLSLKDGVTFSAVSAVALLDRTPLITNLLVTASSLTQYRGYQLQANNTSAAYLGLSAEL